MEYNAQDLHDLIVYIEEIEEELKQTKEQLYCRDSVVKALQNEIETIRIQSKKMSIDMLDVNVFDEMRPGCCRHLDDNNKKENQRCVGRQNIVATEDNVVATSKITPTEWSRSDGSTMAIGSVNRRPKDQRIPPPGRSESSRVVHMLRRRLDLENR